MTALFKWGPRSCVMQGLFVSAIVRDYRSMKTAFHLPVHDPHGEASSEQKQRTYSLLEAAQILGVPLSDFREILRSHALHTEPSSRGERVSRREVFDYVSRHPTRIPRAGGGISV